MGPPGGELGSIHTATVAAVAILATSLFAGRQRADAGDWNSGREGDSPLELLGAAAASHMGCVLDGRLYHWELCRDRFETPGLLWNRLK
jgi:hypothetical protein